MARRSWWSLAKAWQKLFLAVLLLSVGCASRDPAFLVTFPAVIPAGSPGMLCAHLLYPNESLRMNVFLDDESQSTTLLAKTTKMPFFSCFQFQAPGVKEASVQSIRVEVRGSRFVLRDQRKVMFQPVRPSTFIQTDKPVYKPGQTVYFRVVTLDMNLVPVDQLYDTVYLEDPNNNRIDEWNNITSSSKILALSHPLSTESPVGIYRLVVSVDQETTEQTFAAREYVLPRFDVTLNVPSEVNAAEPQLGLEACAKYTYGQPVSGKAALELCRTPYPWIRAEGSRQRCLARSVPLNKYGCGSYAFNVTYFLGEGLQDMLSFTASVEEQGTGIALARSANINMNYSAGSVWFVDTPDFYNPGSVFQGKIVLVDYKSSPVAYWPIYLYKGFWEPLKLLRNLTTNRYGMAYFSVNLTGQLNEELQLRASYYPPSEIFHIQPQAPFYQDGMHTVLPFLPRKAAFSYLSVLNAERPLPCGTVVPIGVRYALVGDEPQADPLDLNYVVLSRGAIASYGSLRIKWPLAATEGNTTISLRVNPELAPVVQVLVYVALPGGTVISASMAFTTEECFKYKVALDFSPPAAVPGENGTLKIQARLGALCALTAVDQSVLLLDKGKRLDASKIFNLLPVQMSTSIPYMAEDPEVCPQVRLKRFVAPQEGMDSSNAFQAVGLKVATSLVAVPPFCLSFMGKDYRSGYRAPGGFVPFGAKAALLPESTPVETVRAFFPETWIWDLVRVGDSGSVKVPLTMPDTITTWEADAFCLADIGISLAPPTNITVFQPFFLEITLPYSLVRGERFDLKATVFNYLTKCIMVKVTAAPSSAYRLDPCPGCRYSSCLCASETKTFQWVLVAAVLGSVNVSVSAEAVGSQTVCNNEMVTVPDRGRIDSVSRALLIKAEGTEKTDCYSFLLCPNGGTSQEQLDLSLPVNVVEGSARASVSVVGDIMGQALKNMGDLLSMPYGCGEQNIAVLASDVYIMQYLQSTGQLTPVLLEKATDFLKIGYQRQLNYRNSNGSFSTFPGGEGNNWLTAFVMRAFSKAQAFTYVDPRTIEEAQAWLLTTQKPDGCFGTTGKLFHSGLKGGVEGEVMLTAYIAVALLESNLSHPALNLSLACLRSDVSYLTSTYTTALMAYAFSLAGDGEKRAQLMTRLYGLAVTEGGLLHWSQSASETAGSLTVEMTSYVLLAVLSTAAPLSAAELGYATGIVRWLVKQQNAYGGFSSTQDTVVALQALALYSTMVKNPGGSSTVTVRSASGQQQVFAVNLGNKLVYQERMLQDVKGRYSIVVQGGSCVSVQLTVRYNIPTPVLQSSFRAVARVRSDCGGALTLTIGIQYTGLRERTNMVILEIELLSGFALNQSSLEQLKKSAMVQQIDQQDDHITVYLTELQRDVPVSYALDMTQRLKVGNLKPAAIKIFDYYQTGDQAMAEYSSPCK
ncbi:alpha-2-macroglobulin-like protein 1 [Scleropages formosus]|uniref:alpha-2-macroglobulin-like protein 1 n=1 Tax=Scleropages formosus TaxID=113540 RepID=UPI0010FACC12|nr:alpha-2-macroglobulin-like protein 1 [Scleropages formosus]XP_029110203.1 alpha-2-macroglobulin-like protein 1 [Scleropages formosus]